MSDFVTHNGFETAFKSDDNWIIMSHIEQSIKSKIDAIGTPLKDWNIKINFGIKTGCNEAFIIDSSTRRQLIDKDPKSAEIIRPILRGRDIKRYHYDFANLWLINSHNGIKELCISPININEYTAIKNHLDNYYEKLSKRQDKGITPYNLRNCAYMDEFSKQKIVWKRIGSLLRFAYDDSGCVTLDSTCIATGNNIKYIAAILNTTLGNYMFKDSPKTGTGDLIVSVQAFEPIKIPQIDEQEIRRFEELYDNISKCIQNGDDYSICENELEELTFNLYGINDVEKEYIKEISNKFFR